LLRRPYAPADGWERGLYAGRTAAHDPRSVGGPVAAVPALAVHDAAPARGRGGGQEPVRGVGGAAAAGGRDGIQRQPDPDRRAAGYDARRANPAAVGRAVVRAPGHRRGRELRRFAIRRSGVGGRGRLRGVETMTLHDAANGSVLVSDFDGTMTRHDFYKLAIE